MTLQPRKPPVTQMELRIPNIEVLGPRLLVQPYTPPSRSRGGLIIPPQAQERQQRGIVLVVGEGILTDSGERLACPVKVGQHILYARYGGAEISIEDEWGKSQNYLIIQQSDVYCILFPELQGIEAKPTIEVEVPEGDKGEASPPQGGASHPQGGGQVDGE